MFTQMAHICDHEYTNFLNLLNVNGVGIGHKNTNNINTGVPCLKVYVTKKLPLDQLPPGAAVPKQYKGFLTDVIEAGEIVAQGNTSKLRPTQGGISIGLQGVSSAGTLGCLVSTGPSTALITYILSNNHVIANNNNAPIGTNILQPSLIDSGSAPTDIIAQLSAFVPINFSGGNNYVDCAIGQVTDLSLVSSPILSIGNITGIASAIVGNSVQKSGRTTGYTTGTIESINTTLTVNYGPGLTATFVQQIVATSMSQAGDSGSLILDDSNRAIGLLFSGSETVTGMNDIRNVLKSFRARLV